MRSHILSRFFEIMYHFGRQIPTNTGLIAADQEHELPEIFCKWQRGQLTSMEIRETIAQHLKELNKQGWFHSDREYKVLKKLNRAMHDPEILIRAMIPIKEGFALVKQCKELGFKVCILSNFDRETFALLRKRYAEFFDTYIDEIVISGEVGALKPEPAIYQHLLARLHIKYNIEADSCWFIDDTPHNITAAQELCMHAILCKNKNFVRVKSQLYCELDQAFITRLNSTMSERVA